MTLASSAYDQLASTLEPQQHVHVFEVERSRAIRQPYRAIRYALVSQARLSRVSLWMLKVDVEGKCGHITASGESHQETTGFSKEVVGLDPLGAPPQGRIQKI